MPLFRGKPAGEKSSTSPGIPSVAPPDRARNLALRRELLVRNLARGKPLVEALRRSEATWAEVEEFMQDPDYALQCLQTQDRKLISRALRVASLADSAVEVLEQAIASGDRHVALELLKELAITKTAAEAIGASETRRHPKQARRLLIIEDEPPLRQLLAKHFRRKGYAVEDAGTAEEVLLAGALADVYARRPQLDCLLLDVNLPGLSGISLAKIVHEAWPGTPMVFITGDPTAVAGEASAIAKGRVLGKPFDLRDLETVVGQAVRDRAPEQREGE